MVRLGWGCGSEEEEAKGPRSSKEGVSRATNHHSSPPSQSSGYPVRPHCRWGRRRAGEDRPTAGGRFAGHHCPSQGAPSAEGPGLLDRPAHSARLRPPLGSEAPRGPRSNVPQSKPLEEERFWPLLAKASRRRSPPKRSVAWRTSSPQCRGTRPARGAEMSNGSLHAQAGPQEASTLGTPRNQVGSLTFQPPARPAQRGGCGPSDTEGRVAATLVGVVALLVVPSPPRGHQRLSLIRCGDPRINLSP